MNLFKDKNIDYQHVSCLHGLFWLSWDLKHSSTGSQPAENREPGEGGAQAREPDVAALHGPRRLQDEEEEEVQQERGRPQEAAEL